MKVSFIAVLLGLALGGCAASGVQVKEEQLSAFEKGKTTIQDVVAVLGVPTGNTLMPDGSRMISYSYSQAQARPATFIPIIGPLVGGVDARSNMVMLTFDQRGVLKSTMSSSHQHGTGTGFAAGPVPQSQVEQQPRQAP
jgi:outer membrane protein assembly factor BamE (lipoprotein component of BamABCDE complex)